MNNNLKKINIYSIYLGALILILPLIAFFINAFSFRWFYPQVIPKELSLNGLKGFIGALILDGPTLKG